jgi:uncharacterized protein (DUF927 family)
MTSGSNTYNITDHLDVLTKAQGSRSKYHCPVCNGHNLDIQLNTGAYKCFSGGCDAKEIRSAIDKLEGKEDWKPGQTARLSAPIFSPAWVKPIRHQRTTTYDYPTRDGKPLVKVKRIDDGNGGKKFIQEHYDRSKSKWVKGNPAAIKKQIPIYRYLEIQSAIVNGHDIWIPEGEEAAENLIELGLSATTTIGGSGGFHSYGTYEGDLVDARIILAPDRDKAGIKYIQNYLDLFPNRIVGVYLAGDLDGWKNLVNDGRDIADDISEFGFNLEQLQERVISLDDYQQIVNVSSPPEPETIGFEVPKFTTDIDQGLFKNTIKIDKETQEQIVIRERIGNHLEAIAYVNNPENNDASIHLKFKTIRGGIHTWTMPRAALVFETSQMLAELQKRGYYFNIDKKKQLVEYLNGLGGDINKTYIITDRTGWIGKEYVTQNKTYSTNPDSDLKFRDVEPIADSISEIKGTLAEWQEHVGSKCAFNSRLIFGVGTGLAAVLQSLIGMESGGFHIVGTTSVGKTTILKVASSVVGIKDIPHWRTTTNGLESIACAHNHMLLPLDEISQADPKEVGSIAYMLANGQGKVRMTKTLQNRKAKTWHLLFLSSGEFGMGAYMAQSGISLKGGQEVRLPDIPAVPSGSPFGAFESIHNFDSAKEFAESLDRATQSYTGTLLDAFLSKLVPDQENHQIANQLKRQVSAIARTLAAGTSDSAVARVANRFALVQVALEVAHSYGLLPFPVEHISWAISKVFHDWLNYRGGDGSIEVKNACERILNLFVTQEYSDRIYNLTDGDNRTIRNLLAYRKTDEDRTTDEFWVPITVFDKELCGGIDKIALIKELQKKEWLAPPRGDGKNTHQRRLNKTKTYFYIFQPKNFFSGISGEPGEPGEPISYNSYSSMDITSSLVVHQQKHAGEPGEPAHKEIKCGGSPGSPWFTEPSEPDRKSEMPSEHSFQAPGSPGSPGSPEKTNLDKINLDGRKNTGSLNLAAGDKVIMQTGNGSDSPDSPWFTEAVSQNGNSQILSKQPSQSSDSPDSPDSPEKMQSQQIVDDRLSSSLKKGDKVIVQISQAVGVAIDNRIKNQQSPKKGVFQVNQYLVEFEEGNRTWLDADVLVLDDRN